MSTPIPEFVHDATITTPIDLHRGGCRCPLHRRRLFTGLLAGAAATAAWPALAREGVEVGGNSKFTKLVSAEEIEGAAAAQLSLIHI